MSLYLVTGRAGFIGSHVVDELARRGEQVRVLDNFSTGRRENIAHNLAQIELIEGDATDLETARRAVAGVDYVLHLAAIPSVPRSVADPLAANEANVAGTLNLLVAAREAGLKRFVYSSSSSVYGNSPVLPKREDMPTSPLSPYAVSKLAGGRTMPWCSTGSMACRPSLCATLTCSARARIPPPSMPSMRRSSPGSSRGC